MSSPMNDAAVPRGLHEMLEGFVRSVASARVKSRDLHKYAYQYFCEYSASPGVASDVMDEQTEERMRAACESRSLTRPALFGDPFNPELDALDLPAMTSEKSPEEQHFLQQTIPTTLPFRALDYEQIEEVVQHFQPHEVQAGDVVMRERDEGDYFYLIQTGIYEALIGGKQVRLYHNEGSFGELALLYHQPRSATVRALTNGKLWRMDRQIFSKVVRSVAFEKRQRYLEFLKHCELLRNVHDKEMLDVADALKCEEYKRGDTIIREGDAADAMYFIQSGSVEIRIRQQPTKKDYVVVKTCQTGDYFGERALLYNERRAATAVAITHCQLLALDRADFIRLLGSAKDVLKRNAEHYRTVVNDIQNKHM